MKKILKYIVGMTILLMLSSCITSRIEHHGNEIKIYNFKYGSHRRNILDLWIPEKIHPKAPLVILVHGGGWIFGDKSHTRQIQNFLHSRGYPTLALNYRLAGKGITYREQLIDLHQSIQAYDSGRITKKVALPKDIVLFGESAGGHLSLLYGYQHPERISKIISLAGPTDILVLSKTTKHQPRFGFRIVESAFSSDHRPTENILNEASPIHHISKVPTLIFQGTSDLMVPENQGRQLAEALKEKNIPYRLVVSTGRGHISRLFSKIWRKEVLFKEIEQFLRADTNLTGLKSEFIFP